MLPSPLGEAFFLRFFPHNLGKQLFAAFPLEGKVAAQPPDEV